MALANLTNPMYCKQEQSLRIAESRCAVSLLGSANCCAEGELSIFYYNMKLQHEEVAICEATENFGS